MIVLAACTSWIVLHDLTGRPFPAFPDTIEYVGRPHPDNKAAHAVVFFSGNKTAVTETVDQIQDKIAEARTCAQK